MSPTDHRPSIKDNEQHEALRDEGMSKGEAARIANAAANEGRETVAARGGRSEAYEEWTKDDLLGRARELDIEGRSTMDKGELIDALRDH